MMRRSPTVDGMTISLPVQSAESSEPREAEIEALHAEVRTWIEPEDALEAA